MLHDGLGCVFLRGLAQEFAPFLRSETSVSVRVKEVKVVKEVKEVKGVNERCGR